MLSDIISFYRMTHLSRVPLIMEIIPRLEVCKFSEPEIRALLQESEFTPQIRFLELKMASLSSNCGITRPATLADSFSSIRDSGSLIELVVHSRLSNRHRSHRRQSHFNTRAQTQPSELLWLLEAQLRAGNRGRRQHVPRELCGAICSAASDPAGAR
jgi:hypothetical protein